MQLAQEASPAHRQGHSRLLGLPGLLCPPASSFTRYAPWPGVRRPGGRRRGGCGRTSTHSPARPAWLAAGSLCAARPELRSEVSLRSPPTQLAGERPGRSGTSRAGAACGGRGAFRARVRPGGPEPRASSRRRVPFGYLTVCCSL